MRTSSAYVPHTYDIQYDWKLRRTKYWRTISQVQKQTHKLWTTQQSVDVPPITAMESSTTQAQEDSTPQGAVLSNRQQRKLKKVRHPTSVAPCRIWFSNPSGRMKQVQGHVRVQVHCTNPLLSLPWTKKCMQYQQEMIKLLQWQYQIQCQQQLKWTNQRKAKCHPASWDLAAQWIWAWTSWWKNKKLHW